MHRYIHKHPHHLLLAVSGLFLCLSIILLIRFHKNLTIQKQDAATQTIQVTLDPIKTAQSIPSDFLGDSIEPWELCNTQHYDQASPVSAQLFKTLGTGIIRLGGASGDQTTWNPTGNPSCSFNGTVITKGLVDAFFTFARKTNRKVTFIINLESNTPASAADEAAYVAQSGGTQLAAFEIGNEPDLYGWSFSQYQTNWEAIYTSVHAKVPNVPIVGPSVSYQTNFFTSAVNAEGSKYMTATAHPYATVEGNTSPTQLISQATTNSMINKIDGFYNAAKAKNLPLALNETNAVANTPPASVGGAYDMSLWGADYAFTAAEHNVSYMNFHGGIPGDQTSPFTGNGNTPGIRPLYYGMLFFHYAVGDGGKVVPVQYTSSLNVHAHAVLRTDGKLAVAIVNEDVTNTANIQLNTTQAYPNATAIQLAAPSLASTVDAITLGGSHVDLTTGTWTPSQVQTITTNGNTLTTTVAPLTAVVLLFGNGTTPSTTPGTTQPPASSTTFTTTVCPHGLGNCGDNASPNNGGNTSPQHQDRSTTITILNAQNQIVTTGQGTLSYSTASQTFQGAITVNNLASGQYLASIKMDGFLSKQVSGIISVTQGQTVILPHISLTTGDINNDNQVDILDYNLLISCFGSKQSTSSCTTPPTQQSPGADLTDDGFVNGADYNLLLREFSVQSGNTNPSPQPTISQTPVTPSLPTTTPIAQSMYPATDGKIYWDGGFETGDTSQWSVHAGGPWGNSTVQVVTNPVRWGTYAGKLTINAGTSQMSGERAEISSNQAKTGGYPNQEWFYSWSSYLPSVPNQAQGFNNQWNDITQWMDLLFQCSPPVGVYIMPGSPPHFSIHSHPLDNANGCASLGPYQEFDLGPVSYDTWNDFTVHIKWSTDPTIGFIEVWRNNQHVLPLTHLRTLDTGGGVYMEQAFYRGAGSSGTNIIYHDGTRRHDSFNGITVHNP